MNEYKSDVVFVINEQRLPALKLILGLKNSVFRAMFSDDFKEANDKEVVIEETTFDAFRALIWFLYSDQLLLEDNSDFELIQEVLKLSDRYEASRLFSLLNKMSMLKIY